VERAVYRNNLYEYIKAAWPVIEPAPFLPNWHIELIAEHLEAVTYGDIKRLLINLPPALYEEHLRLDSVADMGLDPKPDRRPTTRACSRRSGNALDVRQLCR